LSDIKVSNADALTVFMKSSLPLEVALTRKTYPGIDLLPPTVFGRDDFDRLQSGPGSRWGSAV
jgi:hypothetical protein